MIRRPKSCRCFIVPPRLSARWNARPWWWSDRTGYPGAGSRQLAHPAFAPGGDGAKAEAQAVADAEAYARLAANCSRRRWSWLTASVPDRGRPRSRTSAARSPTVTNKKLSWPKSSFRSKTFGRQGRGFRSAQRAPPANLGAVRAATSRRGGQRRRPQAADGGAGAKSGPFSMRKPAGEGCRRHHLIRCGGGLPTCAASVFARRFCLFA